MLVVDRSLGEWNPAGASREWRFVLGFIEKGGGVAIDLLQQVENMKRGRKDMKTPTRKKPKKGKKDARGSPSKGRRNHKHPCIWREALGRREEKPAWALNRRLHGKLPSRNNSSRSNQHFACAQTIKKKGGKHPGGDRGGLNVVKGGLHTAIKGGGGQSQTRA